MEMPQLVRRDIDMLETPGMSIGKAELLCRHAVYAYFSRRDVSRLISSSPWDGHKVWDRKQNQGFIAWSNSCVVIAFRGTDSKEDWAKNSKALWPKRHPLGGKVHRGFLEVSEQVKSHVMQILRNLGPRKRRILLTGHSLGGAIATELAAAICAAKPAWLDEIEVATFGAPRLGDGQFEKSYEQLVGNSHWWFVNSGDPVPHLPPNAMGYRHCGRLCWFDKSGRLVDIGEREVGLQSGSTTNSTRAAISEYKSLEERLPRLGNEEEYSRFLHAIAEEIGQEPFGIKINGDEVVLTPENAELQGDFGEWIATHHRLILYYERVNALTQ